MIEETFVRKRKNKNLMIIIKIMPLFHNTDNYVETHLPANILYFVDDRDEANAEIIT